MKYLIIVAMLTLLGFVSWGCAPYQTYDEEAQFRIAYPLLFKTSSYRVYKVTDGLVTCYILHPIRRSVAGSIFCVK